MSAFAPLSPASIGWKAPAAAIVRHMIKPVRQILNALEHRRDVAMLLNAEPGMLRDLGLTQTDLACALAEPMWRDPSSPLLVWTTERRAAARAAARDNFVGLVPARPVNRREPA